MKKEPLPDFIKEDEFMLSYSCNKMTIFKTKKPIYLLKGEYKHLNYEFIITHSPVKGFVIDGKEINIESDMIFAINSEQMHGTHFLISGVSFMSIQFEKEFLQELAYEIYGIKEIIFTNIPIPSDDEILKLVESYIIEHDQKKNGYSYILDRLSVHIAVAIFRKIGFVNTINNKGKDDYENINKIIEHFKHNYSEDFSFEEISKVSNMSKFNLIRKFKASTGMTPYDYLTNIRIMKALENLNNPGNKIIDVAFKCGFKNHSHFSRIFKMKTGLTPYDYRRKVLDM